MNPSLEEKKQLLKHILRSQEFLRSPTSSVLLEYLVNAEIKGLDLKESTIGVDLLGDKFTSDKGNARIRVNIYHLRKKLEKYYENEGRQDAWHIFLNKGSYSPVYISHSAFNKRSPKMLPAIFVWALLILLLGSWVGFAAYKYRPDIPEIWSSFFTNGKKTTLVVGDSFGIMGQLPTGKTGWFRDYTINNMSDLYQWMESHPQLKGKFWQPDYLYTTEMAPYASAGLTHFFDRYKGSFHIRFSSTTSYSDILDGNTIYVGPIKNDNKFIRLFNQGNHSFHLDKEKLYYSNAQSHVDTMINLKTNGLHSEYALVSRIKGPGNTSQFMFFSDHDIGVKATVQYFTNIDSLKIFTNRYLNGKDVSFTALYKSWGIARNNVKLSLVVIDKNNF